MLITFVALFLWVASPKNSKKYDEAAQAPFADEEGEQPPKQDSDANNGRNDK
ncbi:hypothetical protein ADIMK_3258 [Marinobacterium lacunae]|uniref:Cytochrome c oxidase subunit CcoQ n=2 Tax=Marinobacterium lacunae TaxID=1232683 RepID=A0A081FW81_9GAMM|nr:hypothetical protein ADIMK_3258 [Marinobacterium lacunae]